MLVFSKYLEKLFFICYIFILINYCILESLSENNPVVAE
ncbi:hypothetical protein T4B_8124 [Trichinella pseudospiralis]|uniref:Uncharacterized protein n=1 Tax=Trichinella pseudospiralis TaxID=6337 RepID=A0A0V1GKZ0_TRIPS|nr:hypothetical protein T4B_8124 [Trichinella pseudospiralis]